MPSLPSPAPTGSGPGSNHAVDPISGSVTVPQVIEQVAFSYVNITSLFLRAHQIWEKAEELARKGSGKVERRALMACGAPRGLKKNE